MGDCSVCIHPTWYDSCAKLNLCVIVLIPFAPCMSVPFYSVSTLIVTNIMSSLTTIIATNTCHNYHNSHKFLPRLQQLRWRDVRWNDWKIMCHHHLFLWYTNSSRAPPARDDEAVIKSCFANAWIRLARIYWQEKVPKERTYHNWWTECTYNDEMQMLFYLWYMCCCGVFVWARRATPLSA